MTLMSGPGKWE